VNEHETPRLDGLQAALARGDIDGVRRTLLELDGDEQRLLEQELGSEAFERSRRAAARGRRRGKLGKVIVLPGIMGSELDSVDQSGDADRIWINFVRLIAGRIGDLELSADGSPARPGLHVRPAGVHRKTYVPMLLELDTRWHVRPFAFDWREDIDKAALRLEGEVKAFGNGDPVHLVAHSMGGLVSRRFIQRHRETWQSMNDTTGRGRGGRLVMLGTPNRGSFAISLTLTGAEKIVQLLGKADLTHSLNQLLAIIGSFPGMYQMLPSALVDLGDDHVELFDAASWGALPVSKQLLARGQSFVKELHEPIDPQRLLYVAGVNRPTPFKVRVDAPGRFSYQETLDGDGRVTHQLGLLEGVTTYWVDEVHGNLPKNGLLLDAITELLERGETTVLSTEKPPKPATRSARRGWLSERQVAPVPPAIDLILAGAETRSPGRAPELTRAEAVALENLALAEYLGTGDDELRGGEPSPSEAPAVAAPVPAPKIAIEVVWADVTKVDADVYAVGHYRGVLPQRAELALDGAVSGVATDADDYDRRRLVITQHTRRGIISGALGDVSFFPWGDPKHAGRIVAVAGMGDPGTFDVAALRRLVNGLIIAVSALPSARTVCSVLIGSGEGTLTIPAAVRGLLEGMADAADEITAKTELVFVAPVEKLLIVERDRQRAREIRDALRDELENGIGRTRAQSVEIDLVGRLREAPGRAISVEDGLSLLLDSAVRIAGEDRASRPAKALRALVGEMPANEGVRALALERLRDEASRGGAPSRHPRFRVERRAVQHRRADIPVRMSFWDDGRAIRAAAIHQASTVPERLIPVGRDVVDDLVEKMTDPPGEEIGDLSDLLYRLVLPAEFREALRFGPLVFEVDRAMARIHWEMLGEPGLDGGSEPLAVRRRLARQLRTTYSPAPLPPQRPGERISALVIGDPGDPAKGEDLPGARNEAFRVKELLEASGVDVEARIGAPTLERQGRLRGVKPADRLEVLSLLLRGGFHLVHYAGHGDFDPEHPNRVGWLFARGLLTPGELSRMEQVPAIIVSNACLSARTSQAVGGGKTVEEARSEAGLLPSLADEFFRLGIRNYVGTAWEVNDVGAELFAETLYGALLAGEPFGESVRRGREALWRDRAVYGGLWAAYQHYGDPTSDAGLRVELGSGF
jgi:pimeloyl-ACP methyl ester carboxylesterase